MFVFRSTYLAKAKELKDLQEHYNQATAKIHNQSQTINELADIIRASDQLIYQMTQCSSWESMRPYFNQLQASASDRQRTESDRINNLLRGELLSVYAPKKETNL